MDGFEAHRSHLRSVAYRMLGSLSEADDAVQEAWLRLAHTETNDIHNTRAWLTTVVARVCLDMLRSRKARHEVPLDMPIPAQSPDPEQEAMLADSVGLALLVVLETLTPAERLAFVLHDMFAVPFAEIAPIVGRSTQATKMLASRARHRLRAAEVADRDVATQRKVVDAFLAASHNGDFGAARPARPRRHGARRHSAWQPLGPPPTRTGPVMECGARVLAPGQGCPERIRQRPSGDPGDTRGRLVTVITFTIANSKIVAIDVIADAESLGQLIIESASRPGGVHHASLQ